MPTWTDNIVPDWVRITGVAVNPKQGGISVSIPVFQYTASGEFVQKYESIKAASDKTGLTTAAISKAARTGKKLEGYRWSK